MAKGVEKETFTGIIVSSAKPRAMILGGFVALLWFLQILNALLGGALTGLGVHPRTLWGLVGILFAPFLHVNFAHLVANTLPVLILGWLVMWRRKRDLLYVSVVSALVGGLGTWLIGPSASVHVGASVLIFGYLGYLLSRGLFERRFWSIVGSIVVFLLYGGALWGVLPGQEGISWQGHLFGLVGGVLAARLMRAKAASLPRIRGGPRVADAAVGGSLSPGASVIDDDDEPARAPRRLGR